MEDVCSATDLESLLEIYIIMLYKSEGTHLSMIVMMGEMRVAEIDPAVRSAVKCSASWGCILDLFNGRVGEVRNCQGNRLIGISLFLLFVAVAILTPNALEHFR